MPALAPAGLFGKIPSHPEFVRVRTAEPAAQALVRWLEEGSAADRRAAAPWSEPPVRFAFRPAGAARVLVGAVAGSVDKVGRRFPLAAFAPLEAAPLAGSFPALPQAAGAFLEAAEALLAAAAGLGPADLPARVDRLAPPDPGAVASEQGALRERAGAERARALLERAFGDLATGQQHYGVHCFRAGCGPVRGREPARPGVVLECPAPTALDRWAWLELARRSLAWPSTPTFFWRDGAAPRLLIALGPAPAWVFGALAPGARDGRAWPLTTAQPAAIAAARKALGPGLLEAMDRADASLLELLEAVACKG